MLHSKTRWKLNDHNEELTNRLVNDLEITPLVASLLVNRGINTPESAREFLSTDELDFHNPFLLDEMDIAISRIEQAISDNEKILVFGDYDADGVSSTTVLITALQEKGAVCEFYIPNRFTEGYGPNEAAFNWAKNEGYSLIITVDTGISALHEAKVAKDLGMDLIITDHHEPGPELPDAFAIIHPKKPSCNYPFKDLAGVGVAFKLAHALLGKVPYHLLDVVAIGTIADLVPLHGENRILAKKGITALQTSNRPGIKALLKKANINQSELNEESIGFGIAPRINAVGRLDSADPAVHLLMTTDVEEATNLADEIDEYNKERQALVGKMTEEAIQEVEKFYPPDKNSVLVIAKEGWNAGVIGIVASRLVDRFYRPTIVLSLDHEKGQAKGSARSIEGFNLYENLSKCRDILPHFGGHPMAAGMTLQIEDVNELRTRLNDLANQILSPEDFQPITKVDVKCPLSEISLESITQLEMLAPYGMSNPKPIVMLEDLSIGNVRKIGSDQTHIKFVFEQDAHTLDGVGFGLGHIYDKISPLSKISIIGELSVNEWNNIRKPQIMLQDVAVNEWQLFDVRGNKNISAIISKIDKERLKIIAFSEETVQKLKLTEHIENIISISTVDDALMYDFESDYVVLLDIPDDDEMLAALFEGSFPARIYTMFYSDQDNFFSTIPTREHFKWFYAFLAKKGPFDMAKYGEELAKYRGWSKETIDFMSQVFFELEFVTIKNGLISLSNQAAKRDLSESKTYQLKQKRIELENKLLYSSYHQLKSWFDSIKNGSLMLEEAVN